jgi:uncharacterized RDD family membrane protein YckC
VLIDAFDTHPAPFFWRVLALLLDTILASVVAGIVLTSVVLPAEHPDAGAVIQQQFDTTMAEIAQAQTTGQVPEQVISPEFLEIRMLVGKTLFLVLLIYFTSCEWALGGATLGKRIFGLRAAQWGSADPPRWIESLSRCILKAASLVWFVVFVANVVPLFFRSTRRAAHDYLARTIVTGDAPPPPPPKPYPDEDE